MHPAASCLRHCSFYCGTLEGGLSTGGKYFASVLESMLRVENGPGAASPDGSPYCDDDIHLIISTRPPPLNNNKKVGLIHRGLFVEALTTAQPRSTLPGKNLGLVYIVKRFVIVTAKS